MNFIKIKTTPQSDTELIAGRRRRWIEMLQTFSIHGRVGGSQLQSGHPLGDGKIYFFKIFRLF